jgi:hypothetical protein
MVDTALSKKNRISRMNVGVHHFPGISPYQPEARQISLYAEAALSLAPFDSLPPPQSVAHENF